MTKPVAVLLYPGFQELEFWYPVLRLREEKLEVVVLGCSGPEAAYSRLGYPVIPNRPLTDVTGSEFSAVIVPGGNAAPLQTNAALRTFLDEADKAGALLAAISEGISLLGGAAGDAITAPDTDELPNWSRKLMSALA
ncbi:MAG: DJ-1/PfpI family protein [Pigmentiphaga sp.]|uniref:DJ-1/PfpI family protein n=1 Tax=Pigmentiphaga sp. TaxID=1977564 RepID=UPI0029A0AF92|nr:DJ-1/PfpI family protein [Pigmentiphaga sp.]MDX3906985.1 DJ-1/PfpI family protein [Pigmentiphaga sp.]